MQKKTPTCARRHAGDIAMKEYPLKAVDESHLFSSVSVLQFWAGDTHGHNTIFLQPPKLFLRETQRGIFDSEAFRV